VTSAAGWGDPQGTDAASAADEPQDLGVAGWSWLIVSAAIVGLLTGALGTAFRACLLRGEQVRADLIAAQRPLPFGWLVLIAATGLAAAIAAWIVARFAPAASGSGIPHVVAVLRGELAQAPGRVIPIKFAGGLLAIGAGLALGREGPTVQMGATLGTLVSERVGPMREGWPTLLAAGAGAGLATAFDAPLGGMLFVFEEILRRFEPRAVMATGTACIAAVALQRAVLGLEPDFTVPVMRTPVVAGLALYLVMGLAAGAFGALYNHLILGLRGIADRVDQLPALAKGALVGALVGLVAWHMPKVVGGGDGLTQEILAGRTAIATLPLMFLIRFVLGPLSYRAGTPGGLFAPLLVLGAQIGFACGWLGHQWFPDLAPSPIAFAVAGMAAFFTATVRSQLTGIVLVTEMTGTFSLGLPMLIASAGAYAVSALVGNPPIYDRLRERQVARERPPGGAAA
jgi:CIC family chloride channel protein